MPKILLFVRFEGTHQNFGGVLLDLQHDLTRFSIGPFVLVTGASIRTSWSLTLIDVLAGGRGRRVQLRSGWWRHSRCRRRAECA